jgi:hypothetical protein
MCKKYLKFILFDIKIGNLNEEWWSFVDDKEYPFSLQISRNEGGTHSYI